ncbi:MAG: SpoU rRNA methylase [Parcubacteria group bacterium Gr01-1014_24]|nr:MAG: SpoU rRNA methylase [Parcubacteria group bacterium Gr01-1014_24]
MRQENVLILHNIRSVENVGAMFRTADAAGINKIYLTGYTPTPLDRFGRKRRDMAKSALGAEEFVPWEQKKNIFSLLTKLKNENYLIIGIEQAKNSTDYKKVSARGGPAFGWKKKAFIVGAEVTGIPKSILKKCDIIAEIPMRGKLARNRLPDDVGKESLNVSVALGIVLFRVLNL